MENAEVQSEAVESQYLMGEAKRKPDKWHAFVIETGDGESAGDTRIISAAMKHDLRKYLKAGNYHVVGIVQGRLKPFTQAVTF